jgi:hypothetical protein
MNNIETRLAATLLAIGFWNVSEPWNMDEWVCRGCSHSGLSPEGINHDKDCGVGLAVRLLEEKNG